MPYVVRFRAPELSGDGRVSFVDAIRGKLSHEANRNDTVILKASDQSPRLPTYHFAHAVDDHLMRVTLVIRSEEWISSVPLHQQLFAALGHPPITYAHIAPLMKQIPGGKRKLSKRKDPEAGVDFYIAAGYPALAVLYYLRGLANGRLAELPLAEALATPIRLDQCGTAGPLVDLVKLEDISADHIATLPGAEVLAAVSAWAQIYDPELAAVLATEQELALRALAVERDGVANPRKDLRKWSDFRTAYGFFFPALFTPLSGAVGRAGGVGDRPGGGRGVHRRPRRVLPAPRRPQGVVRPDPRREHPQRVRGEPQGVQGRPGRLPRLDPGGVPARAGGAHRLHAQPGHARHRHGAGAGRGARPAAGAGLTLSWAELNRAVLARQLLLERAALDPVEAVERVGGLQTQYAPSAYVGLWSRLVELPPGRPHLRVAGRPGRAGVGDALHDPHGVARPTTGRSRRPCGSSGGSGSCARRAGSRKPT